MQKIEYQGVLREYKSKKNKSLFRSLSSLPLKDLFLYRGLEV